MQQFKVLQRPFMRLDRRAALSGGFAADQVMHVTEE